MVWKTGNSGEFEKLVELENITFFLWVTFR
jgi:hypothetical protein